MSLLLLIVGSVILFLGTHVPEWEERRLRGWLRAKGRLSDGRAGRTTVIEGTITGGSSLTAPATGKPAVWFRLTGREDTTNDGELCFNQFLEEVGQGEFEV